MNRQQRVRAAQAASQHGQIIILTVLILALGTGFLVYSMAGFRSIDYRKNAKTDAALALARDALLGRALSDANRPGSLPCPDAVTNIANNVPGDGIADLLSGSNCPSYIGRLPWKTLDLPELRDGDGEDLWYALSPAFVDAPTNAINTDSIGTITAYSGSNTGVVSSRAVAVVFSPGAPIGTQARSPTQTAVCPMIPGPPIAQSLCPNNYLELETVSGINNANVTGPYITVPAKAFFNDRLLVVSDSVDLMTQIELRAAKAVLSALQAYKAGSGGFCNCYPWADISDGIANDGLIYGRVPLISANPPGVTDHDWSDASVTIPQWLLDNNWRLVLYYTVAPNRTYDHIPGSLTVNGVSGTDVVLISTGAATGPRTWSCGYVDDAQNCNGGTTFITPTDSTSTNRDRLYTLP